MDVGLLGSRPIAEVVAAVMRGGARMVQLRAKGVADRRLLELAREAVRAAREGDVLILINDRPDVARIVGADGVHVGQEDLAPEDVRAVLGPDAILGLSTHSREQVLSAASQPVDYVAVGPVFATSTKLDADPVVGLDFVRDARRLLAVPVVAIGGITKENAGEAVRAGAQGLAVISDIMAADDPASATRELARRIGTGS